MELELSTTSPDADSVSFQYGPDRGTRLLACDRIVARSPSSMWHTLQNLEHVIRALKFVERVEHLESAEDRSLVRRLVIGLCVSTTLRLRTSVTLRVEVDQDSRAVRLTTEAFGWATYRARIGLEDAPRDCRGARCRLVYDSVISDISIFDRRIVAPFLDAKLHSFTLAIVDALQRDSVGAEWIGAFDTVVDPLLAASLRALARCDPAQRAALLADRDSPDAVDEINALFVWMCEEKGAKDAMKASSAHLAEKLWHERGAMRAHVATGDTAGIGAACLRILSSVARWM